MIQAKLVIFNALSFFEQFYLRLAQLLFEKDHNIEYFYIAKIQHIIEQEPAFIVSADVHGHAMQSSTEKDSPRLGHIVCASVSTLCMVLSAVLERNLKSIVILKAESEGDFTFNVDHEKMLDSLSLQNFHYYCEAMGVMKSFVIGLQLIAKKYPSALQYNIEML